VDGGCVGGGLGDARRWAQLLPRTLPSSLPPPHHSSCARGTSNVRRPHRAQGKYRSVALRSSPRCIVLIPRRTVPIAVFSFSLQLVPAHTEFDAPRNGGGTRALSRSRLLRVRQAELAGARAQGGAGKRDTKDVHPGARRVGCERMWTSRAGASRWERVRVVCDWGLGRRPHCDRALFLVNSQKRKSPTNLVKKRESSRSQRR
jgi:hypothetical protein